MDNLDTLEPLIKRARHYNAEICHHVAVLRKDPDYQEFISRLADTGDWRNDASRVEVEPNVPVPPAFADSLYYRFGVVYIPDMYTHKKEFLEAIKSYQDTYRAASKYVTEAMSFKQAMAAGLLGAASAASAAPAATTPSHPHSYEFQYPVQTGPSSIETLWSQAQQDVAYNPKHNKMAHAISDRYRVPFQQSLEIVKYAYKYQTRGLPAKDILSLIGIESGFNPQAKSPLKIDPAIGVMQVRPQNNPIASLTPQELMTIEQQIRFGVAVFNYYQQKLKDKAHARQAYNVGLRAHREGRDNPKYEQKFQQERKFWAAFK